MGVLCVKLLSYVAGKLFSFLAIGGRESSDLLQESFKRSFGDSTPQKISNPL
jgi:hypothetical protein